MTTENTPLLGIDLGTTNSCVAIYDAASGKPLVVTNLESTPTTPSVVYIPDEQHAVVGRDAVNRLGSSDAKKVIECSKRLIAQDSLWTSDGEFRGTEYPVYNGAPLTPITAASLVIRKLVLENPNVMNLLNGQKPRVVVTFPAHFSPGAKARTKQAVEAAGVEVVGMIEEPIAAALAYHAGADCRDKTVLAYDFGGGTFDCTIIKYDATGHGIVQAKKGDPLLGGADCDNAFAFLLWEKYTAQKKAKISLKAEDFKLSQIEDLPMLRTVSKFRKLAQEAKHGLTTQESYEVVLDDGDVVINVTRAEFDECIKQQVKATLDIVQETLLDAKVEASAIDEVLLVGGSSIMPCVKATLEQTYPAWAGKCKLTDPHQAVALGAAIWANRLANGEEDGPVDNISTFSYGLKCIRKNGDGKEEYYVSNLIFAGQKLKAVGHDRFFTYAEGQRNVAICIYASESKDEELGLDEAREIVNPASNLLEFERAVPKGTAMEITVELDDAGMLDVSGRSLVDNGHCHFQLHVTGTLNAKGLDAAGKQIAAGDVR